MLKEHWLNRCRFESPHLSPRRCVVEVLGPAGAGKTTVVRSLSECYSPVQHQPTLLWPDKVRTLGRILYDLLPGYLCTCSTSRWFNVEELRRMSYVKAWHRLLTQSSASEGTITILDHGPIFMLGMVHEFGPELVKSRHFARWSEAAIASWSDTLDIVVWLDAPNTTLVQRIGLREHHHIVKGRPFCEACHFLDRCRQSFSRILSEIEALSHVEVLHFDTGVVAPDLIVKQFLQVIDARLGVAKHGPHPANQQLLEVSKKPDGANNNSPVRAEQEA